MHLFEIISTGALLIGTIIGCLLLIQYDGLVYSNSCNPVYFDNSLNIMKRHGSDWTSSKIKSVTNGKDINEQMWQGEKLLLLMA